MKYIKERSNTNNDTVAGNINDAFAKGFLHLNDEMKNKNQSANDIEEKVLGRKKSRRFNRVNKKSIRAIQTIRKKANDPINDAKIKELTRQLEENKRAKPPPPPKLIKTHRASAASSSDASSGYNSANNLQHHSMVAAEVNRLSGSALETHAHVEIGRCDSIDDSELQGKDGSMQMRSMSKRL